MCAAISQPLGPRLQEVGIGMSRVKQERHAMMEEASQIIGE